MGSNHYIWLATKAKGHKETEKLLLSYGADANAVRRNGN
jgi:hypothetical protein